MSSLRAGNHNLLTYLFMNSSSITNLFFKIWVSIYVLIFGFPSVLGYIPHLNFFVLKYIQALINRFTSRIQLDK